MALLLDTRVRDPLPYYVMMLDRVMAHARSFDVLHCHIDMMHFPLLRRMPVRAVTTLHGRLDLPDVQPFYTHFPHFPLVSVSNAQRADAAGELGRHRAARPAGEPAGLQRLSTRRLPGVSGPDFAGERDQVGRACVDASPALCRPHTIGWLRGQSRRVQFTGADPDPQHGAFPFWWTSGTVFA
ncbi:glycosyltransferase family protein [Cupriavidus alkaliphilus]|uniref:hypothetical protein n=1 Tax=Cupriavidus alkaliphilus TaxID=942866 RepID=UPI00339D57E7